VTIRPRARRVLVLAGVAASIALGGASIRAAAAWTAAAAPLSVSPVPAEALAARLAGEQSRSAILEAQLDELRASSSGLHEALNAAQAQLGVDAQTAASLRTRLATAKSRLAALERSIAAARAAVGGRSAGTAGTPSRAAPGEVEREAETDG
jgi:hypothetical protein